MTTNLIEELTLMLVHLGVEDIDRRAVHRLVDQGFLIRDGDVLELTETGRLRAERLMNRWQAPILDHEWDQPSVTDPKHVTDRYRRRCPELADHGLPKRCVTTFFYLRELIEWLKSEKNPTEIGWATARYPAYRFCQNGVDLCVAILPGIGSAYHAAFLDELIELGIRECILFGEAGTLDRSIPRGQVIVPTRAIREDGASYHYLPPSKYADPSHSLTKDLIAFLAESGISVNSGKTWSTDAIYRETRGKIDRYRAEGVICVEMESAAHFAVGRYRKIETAAVFLAADCIGDEEWNLRKEEPLLVEQEHVLNTVLNFLASRESPE